MSKTFDGAIKMVAKRPGKLPKHYESDLVIWNYDETLKAAYKLCEAVTEAQKAAKELHDLIKLVSIDFTKEMKLILDDGRIFDCPKHAVDLAEVLADASKRPELYAAKKYSDPMTLADLAKKAPAALSLLHRDKAE